MCTSDVIFVCISDVPVDSRRVVQECCREVLEKSVANNCCTDVLSHVLYRSVGEED